jgi:hypothetical protein
MDVLKELGFAGVMIMVGLIGFFLRQKDEAQGKQITTLWAKHDEDAKALSELKERIAREHYMKHELDSRFERLENAFREGMTEVGSKIDHLTQVLVNSVYEKIDRKVDRAECERFHSK